MNYFSPRILLTTAVVAVALAPSAQAGPFLLGGSDNYALLFQGGGHNTLQITNVTINGNVGVGNTGLATDSGPSTINGSLAFAAVNTNQFSNNQPGSNVITGGVYYGNAGVASALNSVNSLSSTLNGYTMPGSGVATVAINGTQTINASSGTLEMVNGQSVRVFNATSFRNDGGAVLTINGSASDYVAINLGGLGNIQFHGGIVFTGGIGADNVVFNVGGGNPATLSGGSSLDINNNGGQAGIAQGIFLDPYGAISVVNAVVDGRVFGGDSHDFQYVSGANLTCPVATPEPASFVMGLIGVVSCGLGGLWKRRRS